MFESKKKIRHFKGVVVSDKMHKTIVVRVDRWKLQRKYRKKYRQSKKYKVDDPEKKYKPGEIVEFYETRPLSKTKKWRVFYPNKSGED